MVGTTEQLIRGAYMIRVIYTPNTAADAPIAEEVEPRREERVTRSGAAARRRTEDECCTGEYVCGAGTM
jgi:hypothetical protein